MVIYSSMAVVAILEYMSLMTVTVMRQQTFCPVLKSLMTVDMTVLTMPKTNQFSFLSQEREYPAWHTMLLQR